MDNLSSPTRLKSVKEDEVLDQTLRPKEWQDYIGQEKIKKGLKIIIEAAQKRGQSPDHLLFYGNSGLGKTTLAYLIAKEMNSSLKIASGPSIEKAGDLAALLTNLEPGDVLFLDEIHRLNRICEELIYPAMEDFKLNIIIGKGPMARTMTLEIPKFTLIGATTRFALLSSPLRNRFGATFQLNFYELKDIEEIIQRSAKILKVEITHQAIKIIAKCSRHTPRVANRLLKRVRDFAQVEGEGMIDEKTTKKALSLLEIDEKGLEPGDRRILEALIKKFEGGPVGLQTLSAATFEDEDTILDIYEPYLMQMGFLERTPRGRIATKLAYQHLGEKYMGSQKPLI